MDDQSWMTFLFDRSDELLLRAGEHLMLTSVSTIVAVLLGITAGVIAFQNKAVRGPTLGLVGILQTIPSLAMLVFLMTVCGRIGVVPALISLTLYALLPIVRNTLTGLENVPESQVLAARGVGMTDLQQLLLVRIPIACPYIISGVRTATVVAVGIATLAAFVGAGGLGEFINRGLALSNTRLILLGAIPAALLALFADFTFGAAEWGIRPTLYEEDEGKNRFQRIIKGLAISLPALLLAFSLMLYALGHMTYQASARIRIGSKHFSEQLILGELIAQIIEARTNLKVDRRFNLGGTMICHGALLNNEIDIYPEYTGTSLAAILKKQVAGNADTVLHTVAAYYKKFYHATWLAPFGFNNTWVLLASPKNRLLSSTETISDLQPFAERLRVGLTAEFAERPDGYPGLIRAYGLRFGKVNDLDPNIAYEAVAQGSLDVAAANSTDGRIQAYGLRVLKDDRHFFPPYEAAPVARNDVLIRHPEIAGVMKSLSGRIDDRTMQRLNFQVDSLKRSPAAVVHEFLSSERLL
jgi:osmoprotectant transport system permease protein